MIPRYRMLVAFALIPAALVLGVEPGDPRITPEVKVYRKAHPAVVNISAKRMVRRGPGLFGRDPFDDIFPSPFRRRVPVQSLGSGVLIHETGYIVTNAHVVRRASQVTVILADEETKVPARLISVDADYDLAILKIDPAEARREALPHLPLGRSDDIMVGEKVVAIGNPLGYANSLTSGHVSALRRTLEFSGGVKYENLIQIDAPINPGNSGGALLNIKGQLIGINTAIRADAQNIGFAIPVGRLADEMLRMLDFERINRVVLGARVMQMHDDDSCRLFVAEVTPETPAAGKLQAGDQLVAIDGRAVSQITDYACRMHQRKADDPITFRLVRDGRRADVTLKLRARPRPDGRKLMAGLFGLDVRPVTPALARRLRLTVREGLLVTDVADGSAAKRVGIAAGDVIFQVGRFYVRDLEDAATVLEDIEPATRVRVGILRRNVAAWVNLKTRRLDPEVKAPPPARLDPRKGIDL